MSLVLVFTSVARKDQAQDLVDILIKERWAACAQFHPIQSCYVWDGKVVNEEEFKILFKTNSEKQDALIKRLRELHPYELPAIYAQESSVCDPAFVSWISEQTNSAPL